MQKALVVSFFPAFVPPTSGGELRLRNLYRSLSSKVDTTLLTSTDFGARFEDVRHTETFRELRFPKDRLWHNAYATLQSAGASGDLSGLAFALAVSDPACQLRQAAHDLAPSVDMIIHEFPFSEPIFADATIAAPEIYNSHNFEISLLSSIIHGPGTEVAFAKLLRLERNLVARSKLVFATSTEDAEKFRLFYGVSSAKLGFCPNGYDDAEIARVAQARRQRTRETGSRPKLLFMGSAHHPNVEAAQFLTTLAEQLPECDIQVAGSVSGAVTETPPPNLLALGPFDSAMKLALLERADVFLNPVVLGSGTSLKAIEALGAGVPMVSTREGVRGLGLRHDGHAAIVPRQEFARAVRDLLADRTKYDRIAAEGLRAASGKFTWASIAEHFFEQICTLPKQTGLQPAARPLALTLNDYAFHDTSGGGPARMIHLHDSLDVDVVVVSFGATYDVILRELGRLHVTIPKTAQHESFQATMNAGRTLSVNDAVASLFAASSLNLRSIVADLSRRAGVVIFEHCYMAPLLDIIALVRPDLPVVYSAHNVEESHKRDILREHPLGDDVTAFVRDLERRLVGRASLIVCCTDADARHFARTGVPTIVTPNGCVVPDADVLARARAEGRTGVGRARHLVGFLGSSHGPNVDAAAVILAELAPAFPEVQFELIGSVCSALASPEPSNVRLHGTVSDAAKSRIMAAWDVALNPVESGGGSSLKLPDYLAHGLPTLNTPTGARGFAVKDNNAGCVVPLPHFEKTLAELLASPGRLQELRDGAYRYAARSLSWPIVTERYRQAIRTLAVATATASRLSLLVVTYRYTEPPLGGAEEYLIKVLEQLRIRCDRIDLAAIDIGHLSNDCHFGCRFSTEARGQSRVIGHLFDRINLFPADAVDSATAVSLGRKLERAWAEEERQLYGPFLGPLGRSGQPHIFSGFFWPENHDGVVRRWTAPEFSFVVPPRSRVFKLSGWIPGRKMLDLAALRVPQEGEPIVLARHRQEIWPGFRESFSLPQTAGEDPILLTCAVDEHHAEGDHRSFGVLLEGASALVMESPVSDSADAAIFRLAECPVDLAEEHERRFREEQFDLWVKSLRRLATERPVQVEADFAAVRGPHSAALQDWLAAHAGDYDTVLVQGIPFDVIPSTVATLRKLPEPPRIVTLPHFHGDDRFYYWRRYLDSFENADATLLFSSSISGLLGGATNFKIVPGGGVRPEEHGGVDDIARFRALHSGDTPFFLVLGRKTGSKGYRRVMEALQAVREQGHHLDVVLIGPDEDSIPVKAPGVHYLGPQPREIVRGALFECLGLVTMSSSESFGIVLCEAWLFGKPVIANAACYSFRELLEDGKAGILVSSNSELEIAMKRLASNSTERSEMGRAGRTYVLKRFTWSKVAREVYESINKDSKDQFSKKSHRSPLQRRSPESL